MTRVIESIASIYFCVSEPDAWQKVIAQLGIVFESDACALAFYDLTKPDGRYLFHHGLAADAAARFAARFASGEPWLVRTVRAGQPGRAFLDRAGSAQPSCGGRSAIEGSARRACSTRAAGSSNERATRWSARPRPAAIRSRP